MPAFQSHNAVMGVPRTVGPKMASGFNEVIPYYEERNYLVSGVTKDSTGAALGGCTVKLFNSATNIMEQTVISDASGNFSFNVNKTQTWYLVSFKAGAPEVAGVSNNALVAS